MCIYLYARKCTHGCLCLYNVKVKALGKQWYLYNFHISTLGDFFFFFNVRMLFILCVLDLKKKTYQVNLVVAEGIIIGSSPLILYICDS